VPLRTFSTSFLETFSNSRSSCSTVLCCNLNPKYSSLRSPSSLNSFGILVSRIFWNVLQIMSHRLLGR
jgi:hypothetical protein